MPMPRRLTTVPSNWPRVIPPGDPAIWKGYSVRPLPVRLTPDAAKVAKGSSAWLVEWLNAAQQPHAVKSVRSTTERIIVLIEKIQALARASAMLERRPRPPDDYNEFIRLRCEM